MMEGQHDLPIIEIRHPGVDIADRNQIRLPTAFLNFAQNLNDRLREIVVESE